MKLWGQIVNTRNAGRCSHPKERGSAWRSSLSLLCHAWLIFSSYFHIIKKSVWVHFSNFITRRALKVKKPRQKVGWKTAHLWYFVKMTSNPIQIVTIWSCLNHQSHHRASTPPTPPDQRPICTKSISNTTTKAVEVALTISSSILLITLSKSEK